MKKFQAIPMLVYVPEGAGDRPVEDVLREALTKTIPDAVLFVAEDFTDGEAVETEGAQLSARIRDVCGSC